MSQLARRKNLLSQLRDRRMNSSEIDRWIKANVVPLAKQLGKLIQSVRKLHKRSYTRSTEMNLTSE